MNRRTYALLMMIVTLLVSGGVLALQPSAAVAAPAGLVLPVPADSGTWRVLSGYNDGGEHKGASAFGLDLQRTTNPQDTAIIAPASGTIIASFKCTIWHGQTSHEAGAGIKVRTDILSASGKYLIYEICHLAQAPTAQPTKGQSLGAMYLDPEGTATHVHVALFWGTFSGGSLEAVAFAGDYALSGYEFPETSEPDAYWCYGSYQPQCGLNAAGNVATVKATLTSPTAGTTFPGSSVTFTRSTGVGMSGFYLYLGSVVGGNDVFSGPMPSQSLQVSGIPIDGRQIYVTLWSWNPFTVQWEGNNYTFKAGGSAPTPTKAHLTSPSSGTTLSASATFTRSAGVSVDAYFLMVGSSPGTNDLFSNWFPSASIVVNLPTDGRQLYVTLWSHLGGWETGSWQSTGYQFKASGVAQTPVRAVLTSPANGSTLPLTTTVVFSRSVGVGVDPGGYYLFLGSAPGASDIFGGWFTAQSMSVPGIPTDGRQIYIRLWSHFGGWESGSWQYQDFQVKASGSGGVAPALPTNVNVVRLTSTTIRITWNDVGGEAGYVLSNGEVWQSLAANTTQYIWTSNPGQYMCFSVRAYNASGSSDWTVWRCTS